MTVNVFVALWRLLRPKPDLSVETPPSVDYEALQAMWRHQ